MQSALLLGAAIFGASNVALGMAIPRDFPLPKTRPITKHEHTFNEKPRGDTPPPMTPRAPRKYATPREREEEISRSAEEADTEAKESTEAGAGAPEQKETPAGESGARGSPAGAQVSPDPIAPGAQQVPNPMGYGSQGDYLGGVITHALNQPKTTYAITADRSDLINKSGISDFYGGDNEDLIKLAHASYIAEMNKYNVIFA